MSTPPRPSDVNGIMDVVNKLHLFVYFDKFMACSWPSQHNLEGIVFSQDSLVVLLKQQRELYEEDFRERLTVSHKAEATGAHG